MADSSLLRGRQSALTVTVESATKPERVYCIVMSLMHAGCARVIVIFPVYSPTCV